MSSEHDHEFTELELESATEYSDAYALVIKGKSMIEDHIQDKDYVVIKPQSTFENGDIVVAVHLTSDGRSTLKRIFVEQGRIRLQPANSEADTILVSQDEWDREWQVQGKVIAIFRKSRVI